jgi:membrane peptidoglycan carboxypeptidase
MGNAASQVTPLGVVKGVYPVFGGTWPAITWQQFMSQALAGVAPTPFTQPAPIVPPQQAAALAAPSTPTTVPVQAGPAGSVEGTPLGGPYQIPAPLPDAPEPPPPTTLPPPTTTTLPPPTTTSTTRPAKPGPTTTTAPPGGPGG